MPTLYCTESDVRKYLPPNVTVEGDNPTPDFRNPSPETVQIEDIEYFIESVSRYIDSMLGSLYDVPFKRINLGGEIDFPRPIKLVASIYAAQEIYKQKLQGVDSNYSEAQQARAKYAEGILVDIQNGEIRLYGNRGNRGDRFVKSTLRGAPKNPGVGGKSSND
jgi:hypothetical protein